MGLPSILVPFMGLGLFGDEQVPSSVKVWVLESIDSSPKALP